MAFNCDCLGKEKARERNGEAWSHYSADRKQDDSLRRGIRHRAGGPTVGPGARWGQYWDRLRISRLYRSARVCSTRLLRPARRLLQRSLCSVWTASTPLQASLSPCATLSALLLLLLRPDTHAETCRISFARATSAR